MYDYKDKKVVVYCRSGHRSVTACNLLAEEGFEHLYNLNSGIIDYMS
ncbi:rhodanese-like domain-containing protein [Clostridioides difficile]|nr:rhodanese-like domain-containing protein [Clostridioides difficile]MDY6687796.1 rhodanese-like domain-containing protein [Clostridioides difficile]